jgi:hypothetical protein
MYASRVTAVTAQVIADRNRVHDEVDVRTDVMRLIAPGEPCAFPGIPRIRDATIGGSDCRASGEITLAGPAGASVTVKPLLDCVVVHGSGANQVVTAFYGFDNPGSFVTLDYGDQNGFSPGEVEQGQPELFTSGVYPMVFNASFLTADFSTVSWTLNGVSVSASASSPACVTGTTTPASDVSATAATLNGAVDPGGNDTTYIFQYGTSPNYGSSTAVTDAGSGLVPVAVQAGLTGLQRSTTYYYRLVTTTTFFQSPNATPITSTSDGPQQTFTTLSSPPMMLTTSTLPAGQLGAAYSATLTATGGTTPYTWSVSHGILPFGLRLDAKTGVISGRPLFPGTSRFTLTVTDSAVPVQESLSEQFTLTIGVGL